MKNAIKYNGVWLYGLSGSGKTYASKFLNLKIKKSILIDGDQVRKYVSRDLGYTKKEREVQIQRVFGIAKIALGSKLFPIISTVYFNKNLKEKCKKAKIVTLKIMRKDFKKIIHSHKTYKNNKNVVGKDIKYEKFSSKIIINDNTKRFLYLLSDLLLR